MKVIVVTGSDLTKILVISMTGADERRRSFAEDVNTFLSWSFFDAQTSIDPRLHYSEEDAIIAKGRPLRPGELGCYSSHYALWHQLLNDENASQYIILEDDVIADWSFLEPFAAVDHSARGHDYIRLYYKKPTPHRPVEADFVCRANWLIEVTGYCFGTQGYLITKKGARRFIDALTKVDRPVDDAMDRSWIHGVRNLAVFPFPLMERRVPSGIGLDRFKAYTIPSHLKWRRKFALLRERAGYQIRSKSRLLFQR